MSHDALFRDLIGAGWSVADIVKGYRVSEEAVLAAIGRAEAK